MNNLSQVARRAAELVRSGRFEPPYIAYQAIDEATLPMAMIDECCDLSRAFRATIRQRSHGLMGAEEVAALFERIAEEEDGRGWRGRRSDYISIHEQ